MRASLTNLLFGTGLVLSTACAHEGPTSGAFPPLPPGAINAQSLQPGRWVYQVRSIMGGRAHTLRSTNTLILSRHASGEQTEWLLVSDDGGKPDPRRGIWATHLDSALLSYDDLYPVEHRRYLRTQRNPSRLLLLHEVRSHRVVGSLGFRQDRQIDIGLHGDGATVLHAEHLMIMLQALAVDRQWSGSFHVLGFQTASPSLVNVRVIGDARIAVPAGTFETWVVEISDSSDSLLWWIAKDTGWLVQAEEARDGDWSRQLVLSDWSSVD